MNRAWAEVLAALLVAATETLVQMVKKLKEKGKPARQSLRSYCGRHPPPSP
jgi:hypothetical protein